MSHTIMRVIGQALLPNVHPSHTQLQETRYCRMWPSQKGPESYNATVSASVSNFTSAAPVRPCSATVDFTKLPKSVKSPL